MDFIATYFDVFLFSGWYSLTWCYWCCELLLMLIMPGVFTCPWKSVNLTLTVSWPWKYLKMTRLLGLLQKFLRVV